MKYVHLPEHSGFSYVDEQIEIKLDGIGRESVRTLVEHLFLGGPHKPELIERVYFSIGFEHEVGHLTSLSAVMMLDEIDRRFFSILTSCLPPKVDPNQQPELYARWFQSRQNYLLGRNDAERLILRGNSAEAIGCPVIPPLDPPKSSGEIF